MGTRLRMAFDAMGGLSSFRVEDHGKHRDGAFIIFAFSTHVADPGWEIGRHDKFLAQPGEISNVSPVHYTRWAFITGD